MIWPAHCVAISRVRRQRNRDCTMPLSTVSEVGPVCVQMHACSCAYVTCLLPAAIAGLLSLGIRGMFVPFVVLGGVFAWAWGSAQLHCDKSSGSATWCRLECMPVANSAQSRGVIDWCG